VNGAGRAPRLTALLVAVAGAAMAAGGGLLLGLGGTSYYLIAGIGLLLTALLLWRGKATALLLYLLIYVGTLIWAYREVGLDGWQLEPRLLMPTLLGLWLLSPPVTRRLDGAVRSPLRKSFALIGIVGVFGAAWAGLHDQGFHEPENSAPQTTASNTAPTPDDGEWRYYGRTPRGERYSPLAQITPQNVRALRRVWEIHTGDLPKDTENRHGYEFNFEVTPIKVGDSLYICTPHSAVMALDARTGATRWKFDPRPDTSNNAYLACRGVAYYENANAAPTATACAKRIISPVGDARLMALDADTGKLCDNFGDHGFVSLRQYIGAVPKGFHFVSSPPLVVHDRVLLGGWIYDGQKTNEPSGAVRAFDPVSGKLVWAWDLALPHALQNPPADTQLTRGTPNAWGVYTADVDANLAYLPLGNAVPDYYGGKRRDFDEQYSSSVVAVDITTGEPRWHFQTTHHDVWDYDVPIGPSLVDLPGGDGGATIPALVQTTKRGELFLLDRRDGHPLADVVEKPAPQGSIDGEHLAATQPYSTGMPSFAPPDIRESDAWGATPLDQLLCRIQFRQMRYQGQFTPLSEQKTLVYPAFDGVIDWHGASIDPHSKWLLANLSYIPFTAQVIPREKAEKQGLVEPWNGSDTETPPRPKDFSINPQYGTPYVVVVKPWLNFLDVPCKAPPWGLLAAVDLKTRKIVWRHDVGTTRDTGPMNIHYNLPLTTGVFNIGGNIVTAGGVIFMGATADDYLRAFEESSGRELWRARLPAGGQATPMTYSEGGRQYVVIASGGHGGLRTRPGDSLVAYALPDASSSAPPGKGDAR
jgi:quinoprotein glucose dehydrogenase